MGDFIRPFLCAVESTKRSCLGNACWSFDYALVLVELHASFVVVLLANIPCTSRKPAGSRRAPEHLECFQLSGTGA